jgi:hypothetical protein
VVLVDGHLILSVKAVEVADTALRGTISTTTNSNRTTINTAVQPKRRRACCRDY